jgi:hypothetical protein
MASMRWLGLSAAATLVALGLWACGADGGATDDDDASGGASSTGANTGGAVDAVTIGNGGSVGVGVGGGCSTLCSADLKKVLDCSGNVLLSCGVDEACLNGTCSNDPCGAADAAKSSYGCDYWALKPDLISEGSGACYSVFVANTWDVPVHIDVFRLGAQYTNTSFIRIPQGQGQGITYAPYDPVGGLPVGQVAILFLSRDNGFLPACPVAPALAGQSGVLGTGRGQAFEIKTDRPVVAYSILPYGGGAAAATSASLLLPTSAWDTNYIAVNAYAKSQIVAEAVPSLDILARENGTEVTILPKVPIVGGGGVSPGAANTPVIYSLSAGEYLQISQTNELTGSVIQSNKPVGVWGAASCLNVPVSAAACDSAHQQIPPVRALGSRYAGVRYRNRAAATSEEAPPWRLVGAVDGTQLTWTPSTPAGAPTSLSQGQMAEFFAPGPFVVQSQDEDHPFYFAQYMTGADHIGSFSGEGDPEWVNVIPTEQFLESYVFFTDPTYPETSLVVVRKKSPTTGQFADVTLGCAGVLSGWQPLGDFQYARIDLVTGNFQGVNGCANGRHEMTSEAPFGVTIWGWGGYSTLFSGYVSYAYPAGASVQSINTVEVPPTPK